MVEHVARLLGHAVQRGHLVEDAVQRALHRGAVVAELVEDQGVVELPDLAEGVDDPADLVVGLGGEAGEGLHQPLGHALLIRGERAPCRNLRRSRRERGARGIMPAFT